MQVDGNGLARFFLFVFLLFFTTNTVCLPESHATQKTKSKYAALVMDASSRKVLYAVNADARRYPASLTKVMTLYMVFDALERVKLTLDQKIPVSRRAAARPSSKLGLKSGTTITVGNAILALVTKSANDVATVVAEVLGGSESKFAYAMTRKARELGMPKTTFKNASGLYHRSQVTTARDMATLGRAVISDFPNRYSYFSTRSFSYGSVTMRNHNRLLGEYDGLDGIKTGYIRASGYNLLASAQRDGRRLIGVVFGGRTGSRRNRHMAALLDKGFRDTGPTRLVKASQRSISNPAASRTKGTYGIQVGAFKAKSAAKRMANQAARYVRPLIPDAVVSVERSWRGRREPLYIARIHNAGRENAYRACRLLKAKQFDCLVLNLAGRQRLSTTVEGGAAVNPFSAQLETGDTPDDTIQGWGVQVGAFSYRKSAIKRAKAAASIAPTYLENGRIIALHQPSQQRKANYLARIHGLSKQDAKLACHHLKRKNVDCFVVRTSGEAQLGWKGLQPDDFVVTAQEGASKMPKGGGN